MLCIVSMVMDIKVFIVFCIVFLSDYHVCIQDESVPSCHWMGCSVNINYKLIFLHCWLLTDFLPLGLWLPKRGKLKNPTTALKLFLTSDLILCLIIMRVCC